MRKFRSAILSSSRTSVAVSPSLVCACTCTQTLQSTASSTNTNILLGCNSYLTRNLQSQKGLRGKLQQVQYIASWHRGTRSIVRTLLSYLHFILIFKKKHSNLTNRVPSSDVDKTSPPPQKKKISFNFSQRGDITFLSTIKPLFWPLLYHFYSFNLHFF